MGVYDGFTVLELGNGMAAALAGMILADNCATVLKVEPPGGDRLRDGWPSGFLVWNRGKWSVVADLHVSEGRDLVADQLAPADVVLTAFSPRSAVRLGVDGPTLLAAHQHLVHCAVTAWGATGRYADLPGHEALVAAKAGGFTPSGTSFRQGPVFTGTYRGFSGAALLAVQGVTAALVARERTGRGQLVETSLYQGLTAFDPFGMAVLQLERAAGAPAPLTGSHSGGTYCTKDGRWLLFSNMLPRQHKAFLRVLGLECVVDDERFRGFPQVADPADMASLQRDLWSAVRSRTLAEWLPILQSEPDVAFEVARSSEESLDHPQIRHNGSVVTINDPEVGSIEQVGPIASFTVTPSVITEPAPALGQGDPLPARSSRRMPEPTLAPPRAALTGVTVVELGSFYAMPFSCALLAAMGARVIKIEDVRGGDQMRNAFGPPGASGAKASKGKESLAVDLKTDAGVEVVRRLVALADVFVVGFRPGVAERLGLGYDDLRALNPRLSYVYVAGYGVDGPCADRVTYGPMNAAVGGAVHRQAAHWLDPARAADADLAELSQIAARLGAPGDPGDPTSALGAATVLAMTILAQQRGIAQFVVNTQIASNAYAFSDDFNRYAGKPPYPEADPDQLGLGPLYRLYQARRVWIFLASVEDHERRALLDAFADHPMVVAAANENDNAALATALGEVFRSDDASSWEARLVPSGVGCVEVFEGSLSEFACDDKVLRTTGLTVEVQHPRFGPLLRHGPAVQFSETPAAVAPGCEAGQYTTAILTELGYSPGDIDRFIADGVVAVANLEPSPDLPTGYPTSSMSPEADASVDALTHTTAKEQG